MKKRRPWISTHILLVIDWRFILVASFIIRDLLNWLGR